MLYRSNVVNGGASINDGAFGVGGNPPDEAFERVSAECLLPPVVGGNLFLGGLPPLWVGLCTDDRPPPPRGERVNAEKMEDLVCLEDDDDPLEDGDDVRFIPSNVLSRLEERCDFLSFPSLLGLGDDLVIVESLY